MAVRLEAIASDPTYVLWIGDGAKNDANAIMYVKTNGSGYFGGSLTAGSLVAEGRRDTVGFTEVTTGTFNTNGNPKTVTFAVSYSNFGYINSASPGSGPTSIDIHLDRSLNGGGWVNVANTSGSGQLTQVYDGEFGRWQVQIQLNASGTFVDNTGGQPTFNYRLRFSNSSRWPYTLTGPSGGGNNPGNQVSFVRSVEG